MTFKKWYTGIIRASVNANVEKILKCRTGQLGFHAYKCPKCKEVKLVPHSCKSRFHLLKNYNWDSTLLSTVHLVGK